MSDLFTQAYNPDVLSCLANLSNDEVFTPPEVANQMLDLLPDEIWHDASATFLDPACKSGVFLREIAKRLIEAQLPGYEHRSQEINHKKERGEELSEEELEFLDELDSITEHVFREQVFGIATTELCSLLSRRSVYCSKYPTSKYSVIRFADDQPMGNVRYMQCAHDWVSGRCKFCGASQEQLDRDDDSESYAYEFIHWDDPEEHLSMKFDVIVGNPPYQMSFGISGGNRSNAKSIYNLFISNAIKLHPRYLLMIAPSRWMTKTSQGIPDSWVDDMLNDHRFSIMHDFANASDCFPGVEIKGGVSYFLWDSKHDGPCHYIYHRPNSSETFERHGLLDEKGAGIVIRDPEANKIIDLISSVEGKYYQSPKRNFSGLVSPKHFFDNSELLTSNWSGFAREQSSEHPLRYYPNKRMFDVEEAWISESQVPKNRQTIPLNKVFIPAAGGSGTDQMVLGKPFLGEAGSVCSQTYLVIGYDPNLHNFSKDECINIISYIKTKFFRYLVSVKKKTQNGPRGVYQFVPILDFTHPWTDKQLYERYGFSEEEIDLVESAIKPMELGD